MISDNYIVSLNYHHKQTILALNCDYFEILIHQLKNVFWVCMDPGSFVRSGGPGPTIRKKICIFLVLNLLYKGDPIGYFKENYQIPRFQSGPTFSRGEGVQLLITMETYKISDFLGGSLPPVPTLDMRTDCSFEYSQHMFLLRNNFFLRTCPYLEIHCIVIAKILEF